MRTRMMGIFLFFALGIIAAYHINISYTLVLAGIAAVIVGAAIIFLRSKAVFGMVFTVFFAIGGCAYMIATDVPDGYNDEYVTVIGRVSEIPYTYDGEMYYYIIEPESITYLGETKKFDKRVRLCSESVYEYGDCIYASGFLKEFNEQLNDGGFNSRLYNKSRSVFFRMTDIESGFHDKYYKISARDTLLYIQNKCSQYIDSSYTGKANAYLKAFITGNFKGFDEELEDILVFSGARRYLYAPFVHMTMILFILGVVFAVFRTGRYTRDTISAVIILLYAFCNDTRPLFLRVFFAAAFVLLYKKKFGYINRVDTLATAGFGALIVNPLFVFDAGFVLSVTFGVLNIMFEEPLAKLFSFMGKFRYVMASWFIGFVGLMPVYAIFFEGTSLISTLTSIIVVPLVMMIVVAFYISMFLDRVFGVIAFANTVLSAFMFGFDEVVMLLSQIPFSYNHIAAPTPYQTALFYGVLLTVYNSISYRKNETVVLFLKTVCICMTVVVSIGYIKDIGKLKIMFVNVGQGDGAVISMSYREKLLIDGGGSEVYSDYNEGRYVYVPFLQSRGIYSANAIVTHYHKDHCQGIVEAIKSIDVDTLYMPDCEPENEWRHELLRTAKEYGTKVEFVGCGDKIVYSSGMTVKFISPDNADLTSDDLNETSLVAYVKYGEFSALFTGDTTKTQEEKFISRGLAEECDILKVAHHGSDTSSSTEFINAVSPEVAVISVGEDNTYDLPDDEVLERFMGIDVFRTDENGNITVIADKNGDYSIQKFR